MTKVLILGGTGAMGSHLRGKLASRGFDVVVTSRRERQSEPGVRFVKGDASDDRFLKEVLKKERPDAVVDFLSYGTIQFMNRRDVLLKGTSHYVFLSSCRVFSGEEVHIEASPRLLDVVDDETYLKTDEYGLAKAREENLLRESGCKNWTIVRPCITYTAPRFQFGCLEAATFLARVQQGLPSPIPTEMLDKRTTMMWGGDAAEMMARLVLNPCAYGEEFNVVTGESHTWREVASYYHDLVGLKYVECSLDEYKTFCYPWQVTYGRMVHHCFDNTKVLAATKMRQEDLLPLKVGLAHEIAGVGKIVPDVWRNAMIDRLLHTTVSLDLGLRRKLTGYYAVRYPVLQRVVAGVHKLKNLI